MVHWGLAFAESADAFQALLLESQMARLSGVLNTSAADYLAGQLDASLGIDGASLVTSARQPQQTPTRDPEQLLRAVLHSPLGGAARREFRYVTAAVRLFLRTCREARAAHDLYQIIAYGESYRLFRCGRRLRCAATLALARSVQRRRRSTT
jgi:hypothetical protein